MGIGPSFALSGRPDLGGEDRGQNLNLAGSNMLRKQQVDDETIRRADRIVVDQIDKAMIESGDLAGPVERRITS